MSRLIRLSDRPELIESAARWFHEKWGVPVAAYLESMREGLSADIPEWYLALEGERIVSGLGVIENDFHERIDLTPNVCAVFVEQEFRNRGIAGKLLELAVCDMASKGVTLLYLVTDHDSFYERYGWEYLCPVKCDGGEVSRMYVHRYTK